jgi:hypothetical protein
MDQARNVRVALREVSLFREMAISLQHYPARAEYQAENSEAATSAVEEKAVNFDKLWADFMDTAPATAGLWIWRRSWAIY